MFDANLESQLRLFSPFDEMEQDYLRQLEPHAEVVSQPQGKLLFRRGKRAEFSYYLIEGTVELIGERFTSELVEAKSERARFTLSDTVPTRVSAVAKSDVKLLKVDSDFLDLMLAWKEAPIDEDQLTVSKSMAGDKGIGEITSEMTVEVVQSDWMSGLLSSPLLRRIPSAHIQKLFAKFERVKARAGSVVIQEGSHGDYFYIVDNGMVKISSIAGTTDVVLGPAQYFGEEALVAEAPRNATVTMLTDGVLMRLGKDDFNRLLRDPVQKFVTEEQLVQRRRKYVLLDVRTALEYRMQHAEGAVNVPLAKLRQEIKALDRSRTYVIASEAGRRGQLAAYLLTQEGFETYLLVGAAESN